MTHGSLFSGIGGFDLAAEWMVWQNVFHCEYNPFCQKILKYYWPNAESYSDIKTTDFTKYANKIDILTGGFPCQPYSQAGKRLGKEDDRHLWPEMLRAIREIQPCWVVGENVFGLINWSGGLVFDEVQTDLEAEGYEVWPYVLPACAVNAPHRRDRVWFVAYSHYNRESRRTRKNESKSKNERLQERNQIQQFNKSNSLWQPASYPYNTRANKPLRNHIEWKKKDKKWQRKSGFKFRQNGRSFANTYNNGLNQRKCNNEKNTSKRGINALNDFNKAPLYTNCTMQQRQYIRQERKREFNRPNSGNGFNNFQNFPTKPPICGGNDGIPRELDSISFSKWRTESIKAYGNAIVPKVAHQIFLSIEKSVKNK